jgi:hypothetical protein
MDHTHSVHGCQAASQRESIFQLLNERAIGVSSNLVSQGAARRKLEGQEGVPLRVLNVEDPTYVRMDQSTGKVQLSDKRAHARWTLGKHWTKHF